MNPPKLRWGILSTAEIARKNWKAIRLSGNGRVTAVASRDEARARRFISECQSEAPMEGEPRPFGSYEQLLACNEVDAVYVPLPTGLRKAWLLRAAEAGKHIVCEKPCAVTVSDLEEILALCRRHRVQFMDGVMFAHSQRFQRLRNVLDERETLGEIRRINSAFSFCGSTDFFARNIRVQSELEPLGCLGDLGWYCVRLALWVMNWQMPLRVSGRLLSQGQSPESARPVPTEFSGDMLFPSGVSAGFYCSFITQIEQWAIVSGNRGYAQISDFVLPFAGRELGIELRKNEYRINGCDFRMETTLDRITVAEASHGEATAQETQCYRAFADQVRSGGLNESWPDQALKTQRVMCACLESARNDGKLIAV